MRAAATTLWIVVIVTAVAVGQTGRPAPAPVDRTAVPDAVAKVRGRVVDAGTGRPLRQVRIRATPSRDSPGDFGTSTLTDAAGSFELELRNGTYVIRASKAGYETEVYGQRDGRADTAAPLELRQGSVRTGLDFALRRGGVISGTVVDEFGEPIENANVQIARARYADWKRQLLPVSLDHGARGQTDDLGRFRIYGLPAGEYYLSASSTPLLGRASNESRDAYSLTYYPGTVSASAAQPVRVAAAQPVSGIIIPLMPGRLATISGTVQTPGLPLPSTFVNVRPHASGALGIASAMAVRLEGNAFSLSGLPPGEYTLSVRPRVDADPPLSGSVEVVLAGENVENLVIPLTRGVTLRGRITFEGSAERPAIPIQLSVESLDGTFAGSQDPAIQNDGTFEIKGVYGRRVLLTASVRGWHAKHVRVNSADVVDDAIVIAGRDVDDIEVVLAQKLSELVGTVTDTQGRPLPGVDVVAFTENRERWKSGTRHVAAVRSDESGRFTLTSLPPERYVIVAVDGFTPGEETNPEALDRWARAGARVTLAENGAQLVQLRGMVR